MADIGLHLDSGRMYLTTGREFNCTLQLTAPQTYLPVNWPIGSLYFQFEDTGATQWPLTVSGAIASATVAATAVDLIPALTRWQLVFVATGDTSGGVPVGRGITVVQS